MSESVWNILTPFSDVAELGQGYMARADGQCLWVPLPTPVDVEAEVPFVIFLVDGTPAFAGTGRCIQVADQGDAADPQVRYEALLDSLMFDERSQPVYDYIVAVRSAAMGEQGAAEQQDIEVDMDAGEQQVAAPEVESFESEAAVTWSGEEEQVHAGPPPVPPESFEASTSQEDVLELPMGMGGSSPSYRPAEQPVETVLRPSIVPKTTGFLSRPIIGLHFQSVSAYGPARSASTGMFEYPQGDLPIPEHPPRPEGYA